MQQTKSKKVVVQASLNFRFWLSCVSHEMLPRVSELLLACSVDSFNMVSKMSEKSIEIRLFFNILRKYFT